jgi:hypothetical protein
MEFIMKHLLVFCLSLVAFALFGIDSASAQNRGRIQIQGPDITQNVSNGSGTISYSWSQATALTKKEGRQQLAILENQLTATQKADRRSALDSAINFINQCPTTGCNTATRSWPGTSKRVDIEIIAGIAFTGTAPAP